VLVSQHLMNWMMLSKQE